MCGYNDDDEDEDRVSYTSEDFDEYLREEWYNTDNEEEYQDAIDSDSTDKD